MLRKRASGVLLHITSLPSRYGIGDFGPAAYDFVHFLKKSGLNYWQVLPLNHMGGASSDSPYNCVSAFAGNPLLISPEVLYRDGLLDKQHLKEAPAFAAETVDYRRVHGWRTKILRQAFARFQSSSTPDDYDVFLHDNKFWLDDFSLFMALSQEQKNFEWNRWPAELRNRKAAALKSARKRLRERIELETFIQYVFRRQYSQLKYACEHNGIQVVGDIPIYVARNSADVWAHPRIFKLDRDKKPRCVAGVPPDYFSETGQ